MTMGSFPAEMGGYLPIVEILNTPLWKMKLYPNSVRTISPMLSLLSYSLWCGSLFLDGDVVKKRLSMGKEFFDVLATSYALHRTTASLFIRLKVDLRPAVDALA